MAKFLFTLCLLVAVACAPYYSQAFILDPVEDTISNAKEAVENVINTGLEAVKKVSQTINGLVENLVETLKKTSNELLNDLNEKINEILNDLDNTIEEIVAGLSGDDASECKKIGNGLRETAQTLIANVSTCLVSKINDGVDHVNEIVHLTALANEELSKVSQQTNDCLKDSKGIGAAVKAGLCLERALKNATIIVSQKVPTLLHETSRLAHEARTLIPALAVCTSSSSLAVLLEESNELTANVKACVQEKLHPEAATTISADDLTTIVVIDHN